MADNLAKIRDVLIIAAIYIYFIGWIYVNQYYKLFGISTSSLDLEFYSLLVYSYNVITSNSFLVFLIVAASVLLIILGFIWITRSNKSHRNSGIIKSFYELFSKYQLLFLVIFMVLLFPILFNITQNAAKTHYVDDRINSRHLKSIQFSFREEAEVLHPSVILDSISIRSNMFYNDIRSLKNDSTQVMKLLGESDEYFIVLNQPPPSTIVPHMKPVLPQGYVYFINKKDILLAKIILH